ncbi:IDEAL domain-containing protein [Guptibacillus algicola]|uniref:IDEAL domain-containing protein n=1 Tax=Guptibacillus algicola TaxID=225844 RepID=UPI001CD658EB|nr:IDEAL domain-containing protein [Alkalihalobacillus algicola]MCA0988451.1 IDEAL domain-containing protein [Alkalihalobacillus algicola]
MDHRKIYSNQVSEQSQEVIAELLDHVHNNAIKHREELLMKEIDKALDERNREAFMELTERLKTLY